MEEEYDEKIADMAQRFCGGESRGFDCDCGPWCTGYHKAMQLAKAGYDADRLVRELGSVDDFYVQSKDVDTLLKSLD